MGLRGEGDGGRGGTEGPANVNAKCTDCTIGQHKKSAWSEPGVGFGVMAASGLEWLLLDLDSTFHEWL